MKALEETDGMRLSTDLTRSRLLLKARAQARAGKADEAVASYREAGPAAAAELAVLLEEKQDWAGAAAALRQHLASVAPRAPAPLEEAHKPIVARIAALLAEAAFRAGDLEAAERTAQSLSGPSLVVEADVSSESDVDRYTAAAVAEFGRIDYHHLNAGIFGTFDRIPDMELAAFTRVLDVNVTGQFLGMRAAFRLLQRRYGRDG